MPNFKRSILISIDADSEEAADLRVDDIIDHLIDTFNSDGSLQELSFSNTAFTQLFKRHNEWVAQMGWHNKTPLEELALIASEVGEAVNECRGVAPTEALGSELADIILRTVGMAKGLGIDLNQAVSDKIDLNISRGTRGRVK